MSDSCDIVAEILAGRGSFISLQIFQIYDQPRLSFAEEILVIRVPFVFEVTPKPGNDYAFDARLRML
jgi:hypothetical protein